MPAQRLKAAKELDEVFSTQQKEKNFMIELGNIIPDSLVRAHSAVLVANEPLVRKISDQSHSTDSDSDESSQTSNEGLSPVGKFRSN